MLELLRNKQKKILDADNADRRRFLKQHLKKICLNLRHLRAKKLFRNKSTYLAGVFAPAANTPLPGFHRGGVIFIRAAAQ